MPAFRPYTFVIPSLPKETYEFVQRVAKRYGLSHRQVVIAALDHLEHWGAVDQGLIEGLFERIRSTHPSRVTRE